MDVLAVCVGLVQVGLMIWQVRIMRVAESAGKIESSGSQVERRKLSYWPVIGMAVLAVTAWIPYLLHVGDIKPQVAILAWGNVSDGCYVTLDGAILQRFSDKYFVAMSCGISNPTTDYLQDTKIATSSTFTIGKQPITIEATYTPQFLDYLKPKYAEGPTIAAEFEEAMKILFQTSKLKVEREQPKATSRTPKRIEKNKP